MKNYEALDKSILLDLLSLHTAEYTKLVKENGRTEELERLAIIILKIQTAIGRKENDGEGEKGLVA